MPTRFCLFLALLPALIASSSCNQKNSSVTGNCLIYPDSGICGPALAGRSYWLANGSSFAGSENMIRDGILLLVKNKEFVPAQCITATAKFLCNRQYPPCLMVGTQVIPQLYCESDCNVYWDACRSAFDYYAAIIVT